MKNESHSIRSRKGWLSLVTCFILFFGSIHAQSITWAIVNAAGFENGAEGSLRWTIGEPLTLEVAGEEASLRVGFMPFVFVEEITSASRALDPDIKITISPNPATEEIHVNVPGHERCMIRILSLDGRSKMAADISYDASLDIRSLPSGPYVLYVIKPNGAFNSTKFIKS
jgi:hypothetical protein